MGKALDEAMKRSKGGKKKNPASAYFVAYECTKEDFKGSKLDHDDVRDKIREALEKEFDGSVITDENQQSLRFMDASAANTMMNFNEKVRSSVSGVDSYEYASVRTGEIMSFSDPMKVKTATEETDPFEEVGVDGEEVLKLAGVDEPVSSEKTVTGPDVHKRVAARYMRENLGMEPEED